jgi:Na+-driven multidrug efflux pump
LYVSALGTAEVAAWGILGALWEALEVVTTAIGNAAEVRVGYLLGAGRPQEARLSAYKSLYFGMFATYLVTACLFIAGDDIPTWMTNDKTLQHMISDLMPLFGIGNIALSIGSMSWTLVGAQGRYRLSTAVGFAGSWGFTIPLAAIVTIVLKIDLQGQTAAIVMGYMVSGTINSYLLITSNWESLSKRVIAYNAEHGIVESGSEDESSSSSGSNSSDDDDDEEEEEDEKDDDDNNSSSSSGDEKVDSNSRPDPMAIYNSKSNSTISPNKK